MANLTLNSNDRINRIYMQQIDDDVQQINDYLQWLNNYVL